MTRDSPLDRPRPVPVIAAVTRNALGGGLQIALGADIRLLAPDARMSVLEIRWGLIPDMTGTQLLPELVGRDVAKDLTFTGRMVSGAEAVALDLATRVEPDPRRVRSAPGARTPLVTRPTRLATAGTAPHKIVLSANMRRLAELVADVHG